MQPGISATPSRKVCVLDESVRVEGNDALELSRNHLPRRELPLMQTCLVNLFQLDPESNGGASKIAREVSRILARYSRSRRLRVVFLVDWRFADKFFDWIGEPGAFVIPSVWFEPANSHLRALQPDIVVSPLFGGLLPAGLELAPSTQHVVFMP